MKTARASSPAPTHYGWLLLILLAAALLRLYALSEAPPGLTHDEADHGITAWQIASEGMRGVYFTIGYGREPLYDYATAALMSFLGPTYLAARLTAVFFSMIMVAGAYAWVRQAFNEPTALLTAAGLAVSFWPLMTARQALRSVTLPALFVLAVYFFWRGLQRLAWQTERTGRSRSGFLQTPTAAFLLAGVFLGLTWYTYMPARGLWLAFVVLLGFWLLTQRPFLRRVWWRVGLMLLVMLALALPLLVYLATHPTAEVRITELSAPLFAAAAGDWGPLLGNVWGGLRLFTFAGDSAWRYNIAGRPLLPPLVGLLFYLGLGVALVQIVRRRTAATPQARLLRPAAHLFALAWLLLGLAPVLITGPELSTTQAIGMQPMLYLFPALGVVALGQVKPGGRRLSERRWAPLLVAGLFLATAVVTARDYFGLWANHPEVRVQYESTMMAAMDYLDGVYRDRHDNLAASVSTITPGRYHTPALAQMVLRRDAATLRWFDARSSLLLPDAPESQVLIPGFTPLAQPLEKYFATAELAQTLPLRESDLDRPLRVYRLEEEAVTAAWEAQFTLLPQPAEFGEAVALLGYEVQTPRVAPGELVRVATLWQVTETAARLPDDVVLFTHLLGPDGVPLAQQDLLSVPSAGWHAGDRFVQLHEFLLPPGTAAGEYPLAVGAYTLQAGEPGPRLTLAGGGDNVRIDTLTVLP